MEKRKELISKIAYYSFYIAVFIEVLIVLIDKSSYTNPIEGRLFQLTFLLFLAKVCLTKYSKKEYLVIVLFLLLGAVSYFITERNEMVRFATFIAACKGIDMQQCLKRVFYLTLIGCGAIVLLSVTGIYGAASLTMDYGRGSVETRYTLGMGHPNALQCMVWALTVLGLYLYGEKMKWYHYLIVFTVNMGFFLLTDSKTSLIAVTISIIYACAYRFLKSSASKKTCNIVGILIISGSVSISVLIAGCAHHVYNYDWSIDRSFLPTLLKKLDLVLTGRIRSLCDNERWEGTIATWKAFSEPANNYYFDMGWIRVFYWYGIIPAVICIVALMLWAMYCLRKKQYMTFFLIVVCSLYTIFEAHMVSVYLARNYLLFAFGAMWTDMLIKDKWKEEG